MKNYRLTFNDATNIMLPEGVYSILYHDAYYFGFVKNEKPNINGFLNHLIPVLSDYQDDLHQKLLKYNNDNEDITKIVEQNIHNVYLSPFNFSDDAKINVPFRINKEHYADFITIHDVKLEYYNTDFTNFIRNLLSEYSTKTINQREYLYNFRLIDPLKNAIEKSNLCHFHCTDNNISFVPVCIEVSPITRRNLIVGVSLEKTQTCILPLAQVKNIAVDRTKMTITETDCDVVIKDLNALYEKENIKCLE